MNTGAAGCRFFLQPVRQIVMQSAFSAHEDVGVERHADLSNPLFLKDEGIVVVKKTDKAGANIFYTM